MASLQDSSLPGQAPERENLMLLQPPRKWTPKHLEVARVKVVQDVPPSGIVDGRFIPEDGDTGFETLAEIFCKPSREQLDGTTYLNTRGGRDTNPLGKVFDDFRYLVGEDPKTGRCHFIFKHFLEKLMEEIMIATGAFSDLSYIYNTKVPLRVPQLSRGNLKCDGVIARYDAIGKDSLSIPLVVLSVITEPGEDRAEMARYEVPQTLLQGILAYSHNPQLKEYTGIVINLDKTCIRVSKAMMSPSYMKCVCENRSIDGDMILHRSKSYQLLDRADRREFIRLVIGIFRYIAQCEESLMAGDDLKMNA